ncbi:MAG: DUF2339 domain-containing protein [Alphaproteobacteria bacterium]|nr:DUF2339 domain-containing protein [Alphaproteobacteria bacterium]
MDEFILVALLVALGWLLGVIAFFRAMAQSRRIRVLEQALAERGMIPAMPAMPVDQAFAAAQPAADMAAPAPQAPATAAAPPPAPPAPAEAMPWELPSAPRPASVPASEPAPVLAFGAAASDAAASAAAAPADAAPADMTATAAKPARRKRPSLEEQLTLRWGVWAGAIAIILAGVFLIRYAIDQGWLTPAVRVTMGFALGLALVVAAEWLRRHPLAQHLAAGMNPSHVPPALAGAGVALCFGNVYAAYGLFELLAAGIAFVALAAVAFGALALALLQGPLIAAIGLVAAFVTPALVATDTPNAMALFAYLLAVCGAAFALVGARAWVWLAWTAIGFGVGWGFLWLGTTKANQAELAVLLLYANGLLALALFLLPRAAYATEIGRLIGWVAVTLLALLALVGGIEAEHAFSAVLATMLFAGLTYLAAWRVPRIDFLPVLALALAAGLLASWGVGKVPAPGEPIGVIEGTATGYMPTALVPEAVQPFLTALMLLGGLFLLASFALQWRVPRPWRLATLGAAGPLVLAMIGFAKVRVFATDTMWAFAALLLAAVMLGCTERLLRARAKPRFERAAGIFALGVAGALALAVAMGLQRFWLTVAVAALLPAIAYVALQVRLPALRWGAAALVPVVAARLLFNPYVAEYPLGSLPILNWLLWGYGAPAVCAWAAARLFEIQRDDWLVGLLEILALLFATVLVVLQLRHLFGAGTLTADYEFAEAATQTLALAALSLLVLHLNRRMPRPVLGLAWAALGAAAGWHAVVVLGLALNPLVTNEPVGSLPILNLLLAGFLAPGLIALAYRALPETAPERVAGFPVRAALGGAGLVWGLVWLTLETRRWFQGPEIGFGRATDAEWYAYSGVWLAYGGALLALGLRTGSRPIRLAALAVVTLTVCKVFLSDMAELTGILRVLSFLGLGFALIAIGWLYQRFVFPPRAAGPDEEEEEEAAPDQPAAPHAAPAAPSPAPGS